MKEYELIRPAKRIAHGWVQHDLMGDSGKTNRMKFFDVRGGVTFPSAKSPGFFVVLGEEWHDSRLESREGMGILRLLDEVEYSELSLNKFFDAITDVMTLHACRVIYGDRDTQRDYIFQFQEYCDNKKFGNISLVEGPYCDNFTLGLQLIEDSNIGGLLRIPRTCLTYKAVENIPKTLPDNPENEHFRLNALRHVIASWTKYPPPRETPDFDADYHDLGPDAWMAM